MQKMIKKIIKNLTILASSVIIHSTNTYAAGGAAPGIDDKGKVIVVTPTGNGNVGVTPEGKVGVMPGYKDVKILDNSQQNNQKKIYNYPTAQQYITRANEAYKKHNYAEIIDLSEEALFRIQQGKLKATKNDIELLTQYRKAGDEFSKKFKN